MKPLLIALSLSLAAPLALLPVTAHAAENEAKDALAGSLEAESTALEGLVKAVRKDVKAGTLEVSDEASEAWQKGVDTWKQIAAKAEEGKVVAAYKRTAEARNQLKDAAGSLFKGKPSDGVAKALKAYVDAVAPRAEAVQAELKRLKATEQKDAWQKAKTTYDAAKTAAGEGKLGDAWGKLVDALNQLDALLVAAHEAHDKAEGDKSGGGKGGDAKGKGGGKGK